MNQKIRVAVIGYGNIGKFAVEAILRSQDMELAGIVRRNVHDIDTQISHFKVVDNIKYLEKVDVALLCTPTRSVLSYAKECLSLGISTVDSYDIHSSIYELKLELDAICKKNNAVSIISAGWDPGTDSIVRALLESCAPKGITYTNFGPGMSMGHSVAVKSILGVKDALSMTIPTGTGIHRRMVYISLNPDADFESIETSIKNDPYFINDETHVIQVDDVDLYKDMGHGVNLIRKGVSGATDNQIFEFNMKINNPALTSQIMLSCARAAKKQNFGAYTMIEIPPIDYLYGSKEDIIRKLV